LRLEKRLGHPERSPLTGCWQWISGTNIDGYGQFSFDSRSLRAHRFIFAAFFGRVDPKMHLHHTCENTSCVNPLHLVPLSVRHHSMVTHGLPIDYDEDQNKCIRQHPLVGDNLYCPPGSKKRRCRECLRQWDREKYQALKRKRDEERAKHGPDTAICEHGHPKTIENMYIFRGKPHCRECHNIKSANYYAKLRKALNEERARTGEYPVNSKFKTHCRRGHDLTDPENWITTTTGRRSCRTCALETMRGYAEKNRERLRKRAEEYYAENAEEIKRKQRERYAAKKAAKLGPPSAISEISTEPKTEPPAAPSDDASGVH